MKLLFDLSATQPSGTSKFHGGAKYGEIVFGEICKRNHVKLTCLYNSSKYINPVMYNFCVSNNIILIDELKNPLQQILDKGDYDVFYSALGVGYHDVNFHNTTFIVTQHGPRRMEMLADQYEYKYLSSVSGYMKWIIKSIYPSFFFKRSYLHNLRLLTNSNIKVVTVSNHSKYSLMSFFPFLKDADIKVFYSPSTSETNTSKKFSREKYYLLVSGDRWEKNSIRALKAFDELFSERNLSGKVIMTGVTQSKRLYKQIKNKEKFQFLGYVEQDTLDSLYCGAYAFVYPTLNEGFGYPPLEAMKYRIPTIASSFSAITEICQNAVLYFNPYSIPEIKNRILWLENEKEYEKFQVLGKEYYQIILERQHVDLVKLVDYITHKD